MIMPEFRNRNGKRDKMTRLFDNYAAAFMLNELRKVQYTADDIHEISEQIFAELAEYTRGTYEGN